jgi:hypothetical protein
MKTTTAKQTAQPVAAEVMADAIGGISLHAPEGSPTFTLDRASCTLICRFSKWEPNLDRIRRAINDYRKEYGVEAVRWCDVLIGAAVMSGPGGMLLLSVGFERQPDEHGGKTALYRFRKAVKMPPQKKVETGEQ